MAVIDLANPTRFLSSSSRPAALWLSLAPA